MRTLIISDLHLGSRFQPERLAFLKELFSKADRIILNGDFWDLYTDKFEAFVNSPWRELFPILKEKQAIYIEGNHDHKAHSGKEVSLWAAEHVEECILKAGKYTLHVEHGHRKLEKNPDKPSTKKSTVFRTLKYHIWFRDPVERWLVNHDNQILHRWHMGKNQRKLMQYAKTLPENHILVTGHTHLPLFEPENQFINTGYINHTVAYYLWVEDGVLTYVKERYFPTREILFTKRAE